MNDKSLDKAFGFMVFSLMLFVFTTGIDVGMSIEKRRHCEALAKTSPPTQAPACRK